MATRLFHVSDLHFGRADQQALDWFAGLVRSERPDAVICTGDLTMRARREEYAAAAAWLAALDVPVTVEPGNHDLPLYNLPARLFAPYRRYRKVERAVERPLDVKGLWLVPLKTTRRFQFRNWSHGAVSRSGLRVALDLLARCPAGRLPIVACHHPLIRTNFEGHGDTDGGAEALKALAEAGAVAILSGHVHDAFDVPWSGTGRTVRLIGAGTLSERLRSTPPSFNELRIDDGALEVTPRVLG
ncbi:MAG: metallophosphoesterase [Sphingomonas fennica]